MTSFCSVVTSAVTDTLYRVLSENLATRDKFAAKSKIMSNQQLVEELRKPIIRKFEKLKVYSSFKDNICGADLADMHIISKNKGFRFLLCVINIFSERQKRYYNY